MSQQYARVAGYVCLGLAVLTALGMAFFFFWVREHEDERIRKRALPWPDQVAVIRVLHSDGTEAAPEIRDARQLADLEDRLKQAPLTYFEEPEPSGTLYRLELGDRGGRELAVYFLSDLRRSGGSIGGKIYPPNPKKNEVWRLSAELVGRLVDTAAPA